MFYRQDLSETEVQQLQKLDEEYKQANLQREEASRRMGEIMEAMTGIISAVKPGDRLRLKEGANRKLPKLIEVTKVEGRRSWRETLETTIYYRVVKKDGTPGKNEHELWRGDFYEPAESCI